MAVFVVAVAALTCLLLALKVLGQVKVCLVVSQLPETVSSRRVALVEMEAVVAQASVLARSSWIGLHRRIGLNCGRDSTRFLGDPSLLHPALAFVKLAAEAPLSSLEQWYRMAASTDLRSA